MKGTCCGWENTWLTSQHKRERCAHISVYLRECICVCVLEEKRVKQETCREKETTWRNRQNSLTDTRCVVRVPSFFYFCLCALQTIDSAVLVLFGCYVFLFCLVFFFCSWANCPTVPTLIRINSNQTARRVTGVHSLQSGDREECGGFDV